MRCKACDVILNDYELSRKEKDTEIFLDLCGSCLTISNEAAYNVVIDAADLDVHLVNQDNLTGEGNYNG